MQKLFHRRWLLKLAGVAAVIVFILGTDWAARLWLNIYRPSLLVMRQSHSPAYGNSSYWTPDFWREQDELSASWFLGDDGRWTSSYHGRWFNVDNGIRRTSYQPKAPEHNVYVLGNSAVFGFGVPDEFTIPSQLQLLFNENHHDLYRVINLASTGSGISAEWSVLKSIKLNAEDVVIFYDGVTEVLPVFDHIEVRRNVFLSGQLCNSLDVHFGRLGQVQMYCTLVDRTIPPQVNNVLGQAKIANEYKAILEGAYQYTSQSGARFYHFLQPHLWTMPLRPYEQTISDNPDLAEPGLGALFVAMWPSVQAASNAAPASADFTHILDKARRAGVKMYIDFDHITEAGNDIAARAIYDAITIF